MKILLIEDEPALQKAVCQYLESEGYTVTTADTYTQAAEKAHDYDYDCIVVDLMLPDGNGLDLVRVLLLDSLTNNKPIQVRQLRETVSANGQTYLVTIRQPSYELDKLVREMSIGVIIGFLILMAHLWFASGLCV